MTTYKRSAVIPAQAGTYNMSPKSFRLMTRGCVPWVPAFAGMTCWGQRDIQHIPLTNQ
jgi:hypothetical protein